MEVSIKFDNGQTKKSGMRECTHYLRQDGPLYILRVHINPTPPPEKSQK